MLPRPHRLTSPADFRRTLRAGRRARRMTVIVYGLLGGGTQPARAGVTVAKSVGGSVTRHSVARVIRHALAPHLSDLPRGSTWVVRALPAAGEPKARTQVREDVSSAVREILST